MTLCLMFSSRLICMGVYRCVEVYTGVTGVYRYCRCIQVYTGVTTVTPITAVYGFEEASTGVYGCIQMCTGVQKCIQVYIRCVQMCRNVYRCYRCRQFCIGMYSCIQVGRNVQRFPCVGSTWAACPGTLRLIQVDKIRIAIFFHFIMRTDSGPSRESCKQQHQRTNDRPVPNGHVFNRYCSVYIIHL